MIQKLRASAPAIFSALRDLAFLAGLSIAGYGVSLWSKPAAIVYAGLVLSALVYLTSAPPNTNEPAE